MSATFGAPENTDGFDIQTGMAVYTTSGEKIGTVLNIAGFGTTKIAGAGEQGTAEPVIQAKTGSGYFHVDRREAQGLRTAAPLFVPFHGIKAGVIGHGGVGKDTIIGESSQRAAAEAPVTTITLPTPRKRWWPKWL